MYTGLLACAIRIVYEGYMCQGTHDDDDEIKNHNGDWMLFVRKIRRRGLELDDALCPTLSATPRGDHRSRERNEIRQRQSGLLCFSVGGPSFPESFGAGI
jgi:hypothetical protein